MSALAVTKIPQQQRQTKTPRSCERRPKLLQQELAGSKPPWHPMVKHPAADRSSRFQKHPTPLAPRTSQAPEMWSAPGNTHQALPSTLGAHCTSCPPARAMALQCIGGCLCQQSVQQVFRHCFSSLVPTPASRHALLTPSGCSSAKFAACLSCPSPPSAATASERNKTDESIGRGWGVRHMQPQPSFLGWKGGTKTTCFSTRWGQTQSDLLSCRHIAEAAVVNSFVPGVKGKKQISDTANQGKNTARGC